MELYKDQNGEVYHCDEKGLEILKGEGKVLTKITEDEFNEMNKPSLEEAIEMKVMELKMSSELESISDIEYNGFVFQADKKSVEVLTTAILTKDNIKWLDVDNEPREIDIQGLYDAIHKRNQKIFYKMQDLKKSIKSELDVDTVLSMKFDGSPE